MGIGSYLGMLAEEKGDVNSPTQYHEFVRIGQEGGRMFECKRVTMASEFGSLDVWGRGIQTFSSPSHKYPEQVQATTTRVCVWYL